MISVYEKPFPYALALFLAVLAALVPLWPGHAEAPDEDETAFPYTEDAAWYDAFFSLDDAELVTLEEAEAVPVITSVGKTNVKIHGVQSRKELVQYTIPERLLQADPNFLALMVEAEKYIGYPYVYGASDPKTGFDCSGFVCWVFNQSGVYHMKRLGANGLYSICQDISPEEVRPGDLVFFEKTMGADVKGITHVGIYVGNNMMIHAGDPVGFADLESEQWSRKIYGFGRLPVD